MLGNDADAEDVTSEVLMQVVRKLHTFRGEAQLPTWLHRVTVNAALAHREKRANRTKHEYGTAEDALEAAVAVDPSGRVKLARPSYGANPAEIVLADEERELIEEAVQLLPEPFRDVYVLADVEGLPNHEIGEMLGLSLPAVKSRLHRARLRMRDLLAPHYADAETLELAP
jgi:RNA polymerase sigma-70 factor, ECF subfamily